MVNVLTFVWPP